MSGEVRFSGFGADARLFFKELGQNNNKAWFTTHRERYVREILEPAESFVLDLGEELSSAVPDLHFDTRRNGAGSIMRIHRDIRFSPDKRPYKENLGVILWIGEGKKVEQPAFYFHLDAERSFFYVGRHMFSKPILASYREAVDDQRRGGRLEAILSELTDAGVPLLEEPKYKRVPRGYPTDHPRADLLKYAGLGVGVEVPWDRVAKPELVAMCSKVARRSIPLIDWLSGLDG